MALTLVMQELVTIAIDQAGTAISVTQPESEWVDLGPYQDLIAFLYISAQGTQGGANAAGTLYIESSPVKEDAAFLAFSFASFAASAVPAYWTAGSAIGHLSSGNIAFGRYLRWRIVGPTANGTATWTFRILLSVNPAPGKNA